MKKLVLVALLLSVCGFVACGGGGNTPPPTPTLQSIQVTPSASSIAVKATQQFTATGTYSDGSTKNLTSSANWLSSSGSVATINVSGLATAVAAGTTTISASSGGITGSTTLAVTNPLVSIAIAPTSATIPVKGQQAYTATGTFSDGSTQNLTASVTWNSSSTTVAAINSAGLAVGVGAGTTSITAKDPVTGVTSNAATLTVNNPLVSIAVTPLTASVAPNATQQFAAIGTYSDGTTQNITTAVSWTATVGATITAHGGLATGITPNATSTITATQGTISGTATLTVTNPLVSIAVTPPTASVAPNATQQFTATGTYADNSTQNLTNSVTWSASAGATITQGGLATAVTPNTTVTIQAVQGNISGTATLTVTNPLVSIAITPATASVAVTFTQQFTAVPTYADGSHLPAITPTWTSSNTSVATISNSQATPGLATGVAAGTTSITAASGSITSPPATLTVTSATLVSIAVTPVNPQIVYQTQQVFTATGTFSDSTTQNITNNVTWTSSDTTRITITVSGVATGVNATTSPVTISATKGSVVGSTTATVVPAPVVSIAITPAAPTSLAMGTSRQYTATATLANGSTLNVTNVATWTSTNTAVATVGTHTGVVKAATTVTTSTTVMFTVTYNSVTQSFNVDVTNATATSIIVTPVTPSIPVGIQQRFSAVATFSDSTTQDITQSATWSSNNTAVATINPTLGIASALTPGSTTITATFEAVSGTAQLSVNTATLQSIAVTPSQTILAPASNVAYQAVGTYKDQSGNTSTYFVSGLATWTSSAPTVVSITQSGGIATGQSPGTANITATYQGVPSPNATVLVTSSALSTITVTPSTGKVPEGVTLQFAATGQFVNNTTQNLTTNVTWASSQPSIATISNATGQQGLAEGVAAGQTSISAIFAGVVGSANLNVNNATVVSIAITPANFTAPVGTTVSYNAKGTFSDQSVVDLSTQVTWSSSVPAVATINTTGLANTAGAGTTVITASFTQQTQSGPVTVTATTNLTVP